VRDALRGDRLAAARGRDKSSDEEVQDTSPHRVGGSVTYLLRYRDPWSGIRDPPDPGLVISD
jgi:hypothetical protein